ncbi:putative kinase, partial [Candidatus Termititenax persephonae]
NAWLLHKNQKSIIPAAYLSPEQIRGEDIAKYTDARALAVLFYQLLAGRAPYPSVNNLQMLLRNSRQAPEPLPRGTPAYLEEIITKALQHNPAYRHQSVREFSGDLRAQKVSMPVTELRQREADKKNPLPSPPPNSAKPREYAKMPPKQPLAGKQERKMPLPEEENIKPRKPSPSQELLRQVSFYALLGIFAAGLALFINAVFFNYFNSVPRIEIPDVLNLPVEEANILLKEQGLRVKFGGYINNTSVTPNYVVAVTPEAGRVVKKDRIVKIYASQQSEELSAPNLVGYTLQTAAPFVADRSLTINITERLFSNKYPLNQIIEQQPGAGEKVGRGDRINVIISDGYPVWLDIKERTPEHLTVILNIQNEPDWEPQNVVVYLQER